MTDEPLLTLRQVADELGLPESTVRYYRDAFLDHIPSIGTGRRRRYPPPAVAVLRSVAEGYAAGRSREAILGSMDGATVQRAVTAEPDGKTGRGRRQPAGISNLELLAAIVDGEREQRDALWQMAKEIVRLTEVLEGQEKVLTEIADHAGVRPALAAAGQPPLALGEGRTSAGASARPVAPTPAAARQPPLSPPPAAAPEPAPSWAKAAPYPAMPLVEAFPPAAVVSGPAPRASGQTMTPSEMERLKTELESERQLVERLRESKVKLEHRVTDAEAALEERLPRKRSSVLGRILGTEDRP